MAIKPEALQAWLESHSLDSRVNNTKKITERERKAGERRKELIDQLLSQPWGRELWYDIIASAGVLNENPMTGNAHSYYIMGKQVVAKHNMDWVKTFHFDEWLKMEQEARNRAIELEVNDE